MNTPYNEHIEKSRKERKKKIRKRLKRREEENSV